MSEHKTSKGERFWVDDRDDDYVRQWTWRLDRHGYVIRDYRPWPGGRLVREFLHVALTEFGPREVDHKDRCKQNNRRDNLRPATKSENQHNRGLQTNNTSGAKGVTWDKHRAKWSVRVACKGRRVQVGRYSSFDDAVEAQRIAAKELHGEFVPAEPALEGT